MHSMIKIIVLFAIRPVITNTQAVDAFSSSHTQTDVNDAAALGIDAFALNVGNPSADYTSTTLSQLFDAASSSSIKLFISIDVAQQPNLSEFVNVVNTYLGHPAYYRAGANNCPFLSTFDSNDHSPSDFANFKSQLSKQVYFVPDFDDSPNYYSNSASWFSTWDSVIDEAFSWETAWPSPSDSPANVSVQQDENILSNAQINGKTYMMGLSSLQYKHLASIPAHYFRIGAVNLAQRMEEILSMSPRPDFVEVITWNDAGESHYIGNLWAEEYSPYELAYGNTQDWPHFGWQPLIASFIEAFKSGRDASSMFPVSGQNPTGAIWYRTFPKNASCSGDPMGRPTGADSAVDSLNFAVTVPTSADGHTLVVTSGSTQLQTFTLRPGLNYAAVPGLSLGTQRADIYSPNSNTPTVSAVGAHSVFAEPSLPSDICSFNFQVVPFS